MKTRRVSLGLLLVAVLTSAIGRAGQVGRAAIPNWPAPPSWSPGRGDSGHPRALVDVTNPLPFIGITPCRIADTRGNGFTGQAGPPSLMANMPRNFQLAGVVPGVTTQRGIPADAAAVSFNFAVTNISANGNLVAYPTGGSAPTVSSLNWQVGFAALSNAAVVPLGETPGSTAGPKRSRRHDVEFWKGIRERNFAVPDGESVDTLLRELAEYTGSPDPELRDDLAYGIAAAWIYRDGRASNAALKVLLERWEANLTFRVGEQGGNSTVLRSFSALNLSVLAALDLKNSFLDKNEFDHLLAATLEYLRAERDLRGLDSRVGWIHATAHTADLLKFLARNDRLQPADTARILDAIDEKLAAVREPFTHGEDERMARAVLSLVLRSDTDAVPLQAFTSKLAARQSNLWKTSSRPEPGMYASAQNGVNLLKSLCVLLDGQPSLKAPADAVRRRLLEELR